MASAMHEEAPVTGSRSAGRPEITKAENTLKGKVGSGGLSQETLTQAQAQLQNNTIDFVPLADELLDTLTQAIDLAKGARDEKNDDAAVIKALLHPAMQLKVSGSLFQYQLVTTIADRLVAFLETIDHANADTAGVVLAFHAAIRTIILGRITGDGGRHGAEMMRSLDKACKNYFGANAKAEGTA